MFMCSNLLNAAQPRSTQTCSNCSTLLNPTQKSNFNLQNSQCLQCVSCTRVPLLGTSAHIEEQPTDPSTVACKRQGMRSPQKSSTSCSVALRSCRPRHRQTPAVHLCMSKPSYAVLASWLRLLFAGSKVPQNRFLPWNSCKL